MADAGRFGWWNIGGWGDTATQCELDDGDSRQQFGPRADVRVEAGRCYDLRLEVRGHHVRGYVDGRLVTDATEPTTSPREPVFAPASYVTPTHEVILKVANMGADPVPTTVNLRGAKTVGPTGKAWVMTGEPRDANTIAEPTKIVPQEQDVTDAGPSFRRTFPPHSLTLIRLPAAAD